MEYVIKLEDKKLYDALISFLKSVGIEPVGHESNFAPKQSISAKFRGIISKNEAADLDLYLTKARSEWERSS